MITETNNFNVNGYLSSISAGGSTRWTTTSMNARGQVTAGQYGSDLSATYGFDAYGYPASTVTGMLQSYSYNFNTVTENLNWRQNNKYSNLKETFNYDNSDRLDNVYKGTGTPVLTLDMAYDSNKGGITTKSDAGTMIYNYPGNPYALGAICPTTGLVPQNTQSVTYTSFESISTISENNYVASFTYNPEAQRAKMVVQQSGNTILTRWYSGSSYVKETAGGVTKQYTYIGGDAYTAPVVAIKTGTGTPVYYYLLRDYLGNITHVVNTSKTLVAEYSYDSWGRMRNPTNRTNSAPGTEPVLFVAGRGFTGHEHMPWFNSINMNGRVYDPLIGQFLSPDNYVQAPDFTQNLNRYSYCLNNPLKYSDPSGMRREALPNPADAGFPYNPEAAAWLANYYNSWEYNYGGGGGGGGYGTMGSGFYDTGHPTYNTSDVLGSIWNDYISHNPADNVLYSYVNVNGDWYNAYTTTFIYPSRPDPWTQGLTASLDYVGMPQGGGGVTFEQARTWYQFAGGTPMNVDLNTIDFSRVSISDMKNGLIQVQLDNPFKHMTNINDALVYGTLTLQQIEGNTFKAAYVREINGLGDYFNFDIKWTSLNAWLFRNENTIIGGLINGIMPIGGTFMYVGGIPYPIYLHGTVKIKP